MPKFKNFAKIAFHVNKTKPQHKGSRDRWKLWKTHTLPLIMSAWILSCHFPCLTGVMMLSLASWTGLADMWLLYLANPLVLLWMLLICSLNIGFVSLVCHPRSSVTVTFVLHLHFGSNWWSCYNVVLLFPRPITRKQMDSQRDSTGLLSRWSGTTWGWASATGAACWDSASSHSTTMWARLPGAHLLKSFLVCLHGCH